MPLTDFTLIITILCRKIKQKKYSVSKGGPAPGKSTIMKEIGEYFIDNGEDVDFLWCSSDPDSLDGVVIKNRKRCCGGWNSSSYRGS